MDRNEAIAVLLSIKHFFKMDTTEDEAFDMAIKSLGGKDIDVPIKWIPVSERLPEVGSDVLITKESFKIKGYEQRVIIAKRSADPRSGKIEWWSEFGALKDKAVLAWMPLPEPWEGEDIDSVD